MQKTWVVGIFVAVAIVLGIFSFNNMNKVTGGLVFDSDTLNDGLAAYYSFEGDAKDSVGGKDGTVYGAGIVEGKSGKSYFFDGEDDYIMIKDVEKFGGSVTWAGWAKILNIEENEGGRTLYERGATSGGYQIYLDTSGRLGVRYRWAGGDIGYSLCEAPNTKDDGEWHHVATVIDRDKKEMNLYVDGVKECTKEITPIENSVSIGGYIGSHGASEIRFEGYWKGEIDEVGIWNRALSESEIQEAYVA